MPEKEEKMTVEQIKSTRTKMLIMSTLVLLFLGLIYAFSMFAKPMTQDFALDGSIALTFNIMMITFCVGAIFGSVLDKKMGVKGALIVCAIMVLIGFCGTGLLTATAGIPILYVFYGGIGGFGVGIGYNTIVATTNVWFPDKVGFSSGVLMLGFGISSLIFGNVALMLRPIIGGMGPVLVLLGIVIAILTVVLAFTLRRPPADVVALMAPEQLQKGSGTSDPGSEDSVLKTPIFYVYYVWGIIVIAVGLAVIGNCAADATLLGVEAGFASLLVGLVSTANGLSRIVIGALYDKTDIKKTMMIDAIIAMAAIACIRTAFVTDMSVLYIVGALFCGFAYGGVPVIASAFARQRYGAKSYPLNLSIVNFAIVFGSLLNIAVAAGMGATNRVGVFTVMTIFAIIAVADVMFFSRMWKHDVEERD